MEQKEIKVKNPKNKVNYWLIFLIVVVFTAMRKLSWALLILSVAGLIGQLGAKWYLKRKSVNEKLIKWIVWSNLVTWLLPALGVMTSLASLDLANHNSNNRKKYKIIAIAGLALSLCNFISGVIFAFSE